MTQKQSSTKKENPNNWSSIIIWVSLALLLRWQIIEPRWIPSGSMLPTLQIEDKILVEKISPKIAKLQHKDLHRGTIVVFKPPSSLVNAGYKKTTALIKRVVGIPGDLIEVRDGKLLRNGEVINEIWRESPLNYEQPPTRIQDNQLWVLGDNRNSSLDSHIWGPLPSKNVVGTAVWRYWPLKAFGPIRFPALKSI